MAVSAWRERCRGRDVNMVAALASLALASTSFLALPTQEAATSSTSLVCEAPLELLVERAFAESRGLLVGEEIRLGSEPGQLCDAVVVGLFDPPADPAALAKGRPRVLLHLPQLARLSDRSGEVDRFSIRLNPGHDADSVAAVLGPLMPGAQILPARRVAEGTSATFQVISRFHRAIAIITLTASGVFLACIMTLKVQERRVQVSALRLVGVSRGTLVRWLLAEATIISVLGGVAGLGIGQLASAAINAWYQRVYETRLIFSLVTPETLWFGLALAVSLGVAAGIVATISVLRIRPLAEAGR